MWKHLYQALRLAQEGLARLRAWAHAAWSHDAKGRETSRMKERADFWDALHDGQREAEANSTRGTRDAV